MLFINNKYSNWYANIIKNAKIRGSKKGLGIEKHHIIPKSLGGSNLIDNLVNLTSREHLVVHKLLRKMVTGKNKDKMVYAAWSMVNRNNQHQSRPKITSRQYEILRKEFVATKTGKKAPPSFHKKIATYWTQENREIHAAKISKVTKGRKHSANTIEKLKNKKWTEKAIASRLTNCLKAAEARKGSTWNDKKRTANEEAYYTKNLQLAQKVFDIIDSEKISILKIAKIVGVDWGTVNTIIKRRNQFEIHQAKRK